MGEKNNFEIIQGGGEVSRIKSIRPPIGPKGLPSRTEIRGESVIEVPVDSSKIVPFKRKEKETIA